MFTIYKLEHYPQNGDFLELLGLDIPVRITKGEDYFEGKRHLWAVYAAQYASHSFKQYIWENIKSNEIDHAKLFKTPEKAYKYALNLYQRYLRSQLNLVKKLKEELKE
jgi:hypothetical protein